MVRRVACTNSPRVISDRQGSREQPRTKGSADGTFSGRHADVAMRRFTAHALDASLDDLRNEATPSELAELAPATRVLGDLELQAKYLPRRPSLLPRLMTAINSDSNSMRDMARIIGEDGTLLGGLLKLANSAFYGVRRHKPIESLEKAVALVGTDGLRSLVATALLHPVMTGTRGPFSSFAEATWEHSRFSASVRRATCGSHRGCRRFQRAAPGVAAWPREQYSVPYRARTLCGRNNIPPAAMAQLLDDWVPPTALRIAENWKLPSGSVRRAFGSRRAGPGALAALRATGGRIDVLVNQRALAGALGARDRTRRRSTSCTGGPAVVSARDHAPCRRSLTFFIRAD